MEPTFHVLLIEPEVPPNTGTIGRVCLSVGASLHLVGPLGFRLDDRRLRRAGLDYWSHCDVRRHVDLGACLASIQASEVCYFSAHAPRVYYEARMPLGTALVFGRESRGLPPALLEDESRCWRLPILDARCRGLNLATAASAVIYEAVRQNQSQLAPRWIAPTAITHPSASKP